MDNTTQETEQARRLREWLTTWAAEEGLNMRRGAHAAAAEFLGMPKHRFQSYLWGKQLAPDDQLLHMHRATGGRFSARGLLRNPDLLGIMQRKVEDVPEAVVAEGDLLGLLLSDPAVRDRLVELLKERG